MELEDENYSRHCEIEKGEKIKISKKNELFWQNKIGANFARLHFAGRNCIVQLCSKSFFSFLLCSSLFLIVV
jgi:hypothetical protein